MKIHFLDVGTEQYGDCILIEHGGRFILIDGAHSSNYRAQGSTPPIQQQLTTWMGPAPFKPDLLIITHVHGDHIGCLPQMVRDQLLQPKRVLAADERWGSGIAGDGDAAPLADADPSTRLMAEALQEEGAAALETEEEARAFIDAFVSEESRYIDMLGRFDPGIVRRFGRDSVAALEKDFKTFALKFLGPTVEHLKTCAAFIGREKQDTPQRIPDALMSDGANDLGRRFWAALVARRKELSDAAGLADMAGAGSGKNNQSIVFTVGRGTKKVLLGGDMQFAAPEVPGLRQSMDTLFQTVVAQGPYRVIKVTHHTAKNGLGGAELDALGGDPILIHTGGLFDEDHPSPKILEVYAQRLAPQRFARTDRNGIISVNLSATKPVVTLGRGTWNNFQPNPKPARPATPARPPDEQQPGKSPKVTVERNGGDVIEVITRIPRQATRVTITVDVQPEGVRTVVTPLAQKKTLNEM
jgi:beta-lactamase superfamily II metal-dependent hydrolase